jgi:hypothetical protein
MRHCAPITVRKLLVFAERTVSSSGELIEQDIYHNSKISGKNSGSEKSVLWIRIRIRIHRRYVFLGLPEPDPLVRGMDPDPEDKLLLLLFCNFFEFFIFEK